MAMSSPRWLMWLQGQEPSLEVFVSVKVRQIKVKTKKGFTPCL